MPDFSGLKYIFWLAGLGFVAAIVSVIMFVVWLFNNVHISIG